MKGQAVNIDWTVGLAVFIVSVISGLFIVSTTDLGPGEVSENRQKASNLQQEIRERTFIEGRQTPLKIMSPVELENIPVDRSYIFTSEASSATMDVPAEINLTQNRVKTVVDVGNNSYGLNYFKEELETRDYTGDNDLEAEGNWLNNSIIKARAGDPGLESLRIDGNELLNPEANLSGSSFTVEEGELHASSLSGHLKIYNGSRELILENPGKVTFELENLSTLYWGSDGSTYDLVEVKEYRSGETPGLTIASEYGITFTGDMEATVSMPDTDTVKAVIEAPRLRIFLHNSGYEKGAQRINFSEQGDIQFGVEKPVEGASRKKIRKLDDKNERAFENILETGNFDYNIAYGPWLENLVDGLGDWNQGSYKHTSASRKANSGHLGIGYRNGTIDDSLVGYWRMDAKNILDNPGFEEDSPGTENPSDWYYPDADGWNITSKYSAPGSEGEKSFGGMWQYSPGVWPNAYIYNKKKIDGGKDYVAKAWIRLQSYSDANWDGPKTDQQYIYEDDARLHLYFYDETGNLVGEEKTRWIGDAYNRRLEYIEKDGDWFRIRETFTAPADAEKVRFQIDGGDNNNDYGDPETSHGGNAGLWIDDTSLRDREVKDYSGNDNTARTYNKPEIKDGVFGTTSYRFDGNKTYIETPYSDSWWSPDQFTASAWIKSKIEDPNKAAFIFKMPSGKLNRWEVSYRDAGEIVFYTYNGSKSSTIGAQEIIPADGKFHLLTLVFAESDRQEIWVDGEKIRNKTPDFEGSLGTTDRDLRLGGKGWFGGLDNIYFNGTIDEVQVYDRALSEDEIERLYFNGRPFRGNFTRTRQTGSLQGWRSLRVDARVPSGTSLEAVFHAIDEDGDVVDSYSFPVSSGERVYPLPVQDSEGYRLVFDGGTGEVTESWEIRDYSVSYGPELRRGSRIPFKDVVVSERPSVLLGKLGNYSEMYSRVAVWK